MSVVTFNVQQVTEAGTRAIKTMLQQGSLVLGLLGYLFYVNWKLTLFFIAIMPLIAFSSMFRLSWMTFKKMLNFWISCSKKLVIDGNIFSLSPSR